MKYLIISIALLCSFIVTHAAETYAQMSLQLASGNNEDIYSAPLVLAEGEVFSVVSMSHAGSSNYKGSLQVDFPSNESSEVVRVLIHSSTSYPTFVGPATIRIVDTVSGTNGYAYVAYKRFTPESALTSNTVTLPAITGIGWTVALEESTDLLNWALVAPGSTTGTSSPRFFRTRLTQNP
jgi:hypothetical protein